MKSSLTLRWQLRRCYTPPPASAKRCFKRRWVLSSKCWTLQSLTRGTSLVCCTWLAHWQKFSYRWLVVVNCSLSECHVTTAWTPSPPTDNIWAMVIVWRVRGEIIWVVVVNCGVCECHVTTAWRFGVVVSINEVNLRWAWLVLGLVTVSGFNSRRRHLIFGM